MVKYDTFKYIVNKLRPFGLDEYVPKFLEQRTSDLLYVYEMYFYSDKDWSELKEKYYTSYIEKATKSYFALGLYECLHSISSDSTEEQLNKYARYFMKHNVWIEVFNDQEFEDEGDIERIIDEFIRVFLDHFFYELKESNYLKLYLEQYYSIGWNMGIKILFGL